jgi:GNAT superfamily N-acetyltransferase
MEKTPKTKELRILTDYENLPKGFLKNVSSDGELLVDPEKHGYPIRVKLGEGEKIGELAVDNQNLTLRRLKYKITGRHWPIWISYATTHEPEEQAGYLMYYIMGKEGSRRGKRIEIYDTPFFNCRFVPFLQVGEKFQGKGIGSELLKKVIEHAKQEKCTHIEAVPFNEKFFINRGFVKGTSLADRMLNRYFFPLTPEMQNKLKVQERGMRK